MCRLKSPGNYSTNSPQRFFYRPKIFKRYLIDWRYLMGILTIEEHFIPKHLKGYTEETHRWRNPLKSLCQLVGLLKIGEFWEGFPWSNTYKVSFTNSRPWQPGSKTLERPFEHSKTIESFFGQNTHERSSSYRNPEKGFLST